MLDWDKIGRFIAELRKEKGMTQQQLSDILYTSRENVSKWERGVNNPSTETIIELTKIFDLSVNELLAGERKSQTNEEVIDNMAVEVLKDGHSKIKKIFTRFIIIIVALLLMFLTYYFINSYNTLYVYKISAADNDFESNDGIVIFSKNKSYLKLGEIRDVNNTLYDKVEIFYKTKDNKEIIIYKSEGENTTLMSINGYNDYFSYKNMKNIIKDSYLRITYGENVDILKLKFQRDMSNSFPIFTEDNKVIDNHADNSKEISLEKAKAYFEKNFQYDEVRNNYFYNSKNNEFSYNVQFLASTDNLIVLEERKENSYSFEYSYYNQSLNFAIIENKSNVKLNFSYDIKRKKCLNGKCDDDLINYFLENYLYKFTEQ